MVHCSAGVGRTGAFIAIDHAIEAYKKKQKVDINAVVERMRRCRMALIQHTSQYCFVWAAARDYISGKLELRAAKHSHAASGEASTPVAPDASDGVKWYRATEDYDNPDKSDGVLLLKAGDRLALLEKSDMWWWMQRGSDEGWVLPDIIEPDLNRSGSTSSFSKPGGLSRHASNSSAQNPFADALASSKSSSDAEAQLPGEGRMRRGSANSANPFATMPAEEVAQANPFSGDAGNSSTIRESTTTNAPFDPVAEMMNEMEVIEKRLATLRNAEHSQPEADNDVDEAVDAQEPTEVPRVPGPWYSVLQPFTHVSADGTVGTLFNPSDQLFVYAPPSDLPQDRIKTPMQIFGPAVVSHDGSWRLLNNAAAFASARSHVGPTGEDSDTEC